MSKQQHEQALADKTSFGFWVYLMTDLVLFATLFATYAVLQQRTAGGPGAAEVFELPGILAETIILLASSFTAGLALLAARQAQRRTALLWLGMTFLLGAAFLVLELQEFAGLVAEGHSWRASAFLSAFFTLVGTHGAHIFAGLIWLAVLLIRIWRGGLTPAQLRRLGLFSLFWHFLDIVWIFIFSFVYLLGAAA